MWAVCRRSSWQYVGGIVLEELSWKNFSTNSASVSSFVEKIFRQMGGWLLDVVSPRPTCVRTTQIVATEFRRRTAIANGTISEK